MGGKSEIIDLFAFPNKRFCPIRAMEKLKKKMQKTRIFQQNLPVFRFESGKFLTISALSDILQKLLKKKKIQKPKNLHKKLKIRNPL